MKTSMLAMGVALACPTTTYANENRNIFEKLFFGSDFSHRAHDETTGQQSGRSKVSSSAERCRPRRIASNL